jgi:GT2 family glycosyltransferase
MKEADVEAKQEVQVQEQGSKPWPRVAIIVLNWNGWRDTIECLESLRHITYPNYQVIVVDNGSTDGSVEKIKAWVQSYLDSPNDTDKGYLQNRYKTSSGPQMSGGHVSIENPGFALIIAEENLGFSGGNNLGIRFALSSSSPADFIFFLNNDAIVDSSCITHCVEVAQNEDAAVVGTLIKNWDGSEIVCSGARFPRVLLSRARISPYYHRTLQYWPADWVDGVGMLVRRDLLLQREKDHGYFLDPSFFMYWEECEFCFYARCKGYKILLAKKRGGLPQGKSVFRRRLELSSPLLFDTQHGSFGKGNFSHVAKSFIPCLVCTLATSASLAENGGEEVIGGGSYI